MIGINKNHVHLGEYISDFDILYALNKLFN